MLKIVDDRKRQYIEKIDEENLKHRIADKEKVNKHLQIEDG